MQKQFTVDNLIRLKDLFVDFSFKGEVLEGKFGANTLNPFELLTMTAISTLRGLLKQVRKAAAEMQELDEWTLTSYQQQKQARLEAWAEFVNLLIGYRLDQDEKATARIEKAAKAKDLRARIATEKDKNKSVEDLEKELASLEV